MADNTPGDTLQVPRSGSIIQKRHRPALGTLAGDLAAINLSERSTMPYPQFCANPRASASPSPLIFNDPHCWVAAAVACLFSGFPAPSWAEYQRRMAMEVV